MIQLTEAEARARIESMTQHSVEPSLTAPEIDRLLVIAKRVDHDGIKPSEIGWTASWDLNAATAEGWRWKAGKVSARFNANIDGAALSRAQTFAHCLRMAEIHANKVAGSMSLARFPQEADQIANL